MEKCIKCLYSEKEENNLLYCRKYLCMCEDIISYEIDTDLPVYLWEMCED